jgi:hypothetical protein
VAVRLDKSGRQSSDLKNLAGMTRIVGMVHTPDNDIVLVGRVVEGQPHVGLDDLVIAMRARLVHDQWPTVSIDPTEQTALTGLQKVVFAGGIEGTQFGKDFLDSDIFLKKYSLDLSQTIQQVKSYRDLCKEDIEARIEAAGRRIRRVKWEQASSSQPYVEQAKGREAKQAQSYQTRFWFTPMQPYRFVAREGVFCIKELFLTVREEAIGKEGIGKNTQPDPENPDFGKAAESFARQFSDHLTRVAEVQPSIKRLKILYDLVAVAEGIRSLRKRPDLSHFLKEYQTKPVKTRPDYDYIQVVGIVDRDDGAKHLINISGGVRFEAELKWLNDGDVTPLRDIVIKTRPDPSALTWRLPIDSWKMPNAQDLEPQLVNPRTGDKHSESANTGCMIFTQSVRLSAPMEGGMIPQASFSGFLSPKATVLAPAAPKVDYVRDLGGVDMAIEVKDDSIIKGPSEKTEELRKKILKSRPGKESLIWSPKSKKETN